MYGTVGVARLPLLLQVPRHGAVGAAQDGEIARALAEEIGVRKEQSFRVGFRGLEPGEDLGVLQAFGVVAQVGALIERGAELRERPALDQPDFGLGDVAAGELLEQLHRRHRRGDLVAAGLDVAHLAQAARQQLELVAPDTNARLFELLHGRAKAGTAGNLDLDRIAGDGYRRADVPKGVADGGERWR